MSEEKITYNRDKKYDIQLSEALVNERRLGDFFMYAKLEKVELKSESWLWERSGNLCIEYKRNGIPSGISVTEADYWFHELKRNGEHVCYFVFPVSRLKALVKEAPKSARKRGGDDGLSRVVVIPIRDLLKLIKSDEKKPPTEAGG